MNVALNAIIPLLILISLGFLSRKANILKEGDERILSAYVYYFALPSLFFVAISEIKFTEEILLSIQTFPEFSMEIALMMKFFTGYFGKLCASSQSALMIC
ncbi:MAG: AEC family transporter [Thermoplasmata archaeon]|nr:AEC family transporter [Thermoplasmata archaeon]